LRRSPSRGHISAECWKQVTRKMPIPCVDTIVYRKNCVLMAWRIIAPYSNVWALIGGRMWYGETFAETSIRNCRESGLEICRPRYLGIFPIKFPQGRHDLTVCMTARYVSGEPRPTRELSKYRWITRSEIDEVHLAGGNYLKMLRAWWKIRGKSIASVTSRK